MLTKNYIRKCPQESNTGEFIFLPGGQTCQCDSMALLYNFAGKISFIRNEMRNIRFLVTSIKYLQTRVMFFSFAIFLRGHKVLQ
jgi:hypothetical protein